MWQLKAIELLPFSFVGIFKNPFRIHDVWIYSSFIAYIGVFNILIYNTLRKKDLG
jgi:hypothetical protein